MAHQLPASSSASAGPSRPAVSTAATQLAATTTARRTLRDRLIDLLPVDGTAIPMDEVLRRFDPQIASRSNVDAEKAALSKKLSTALSLCKRSVNDGRGWRRARTAELPPPKAPTMRDRLRRMLPKDGRALSLQEIVRLYDSAIGNRTAGDKDKASLSNKIVSVLGRHKDSFVKVEGGGWRLTTEAPPRASICALCALDVFLGAQIKVEQVAQVAAAVKQNKDCAIPSWVEERVHTVLREVRWPENCPQHDSVSVYANNKGFCQSMNGCRFSTLLEWAAIPDQLRQEWHIHPPSSADLHRLRDHFTAAFGYHTSMVDPELLDPTVVLMDAAQQATRMKAAGKASILKDLNNAKTAMDAILQDLKRRQLYQEFAQAHRQRAQPTPSAVA